MRDDLLKNTLTFQSSSTSQHQDLTQPDFNWFFGRKLAQNRSAGIWNGVYAHSLDGSFDTTLE